MRSSLLAGFSEAEKKVLTQDFKATVKMRKAVTATLEKKVQSYFNASVSRDSYDNPNWALMQADTAGYVRALKEIINILE